MTTPTSILKIEISKEVLYQDDEVDLHLFATNPGVTTANPPKNFFVVTLIGDIVKVNDQDANGTYVGRTRVISASPTPAPGGAIADVTRVAMREHIFEILNASKRQIGTIMSMGFSGGECPPGTGPTTPPEHANWAIAGGTGAYLGARGQVRGLGGSSRPASMTEDPAQRRMPGHSSPGSDHFILRIIPMHAPEIMAAATGPLIFTGPSHSLVTEFTPAIAGHNVSLYATGLGPTFPDVDLEQAFPLAPTVVDSPVAVTVDGSFADNVHAVGIPGTVNAYQVNFTMPWGSTRAASHPIKGGLDRRSGLNHLGRLMAHTYPPALPAPLPAKVSLQRFKLNTASVWALGFLELYICGMDDRGVIQAQNEDKQVIFNKSQSGQVNFDFGFGLQQTLSTSLNVAPSCCTFATWRYLLEFGAWDGLGVWRWR